MASGMEQRRQKHEAVIDCPWSEEGAGGGGCELKLLTLVHVDGIFSETYRCEDDDTGKQYLLKKVFLRGLRDSDIRYRLGEVEIWSKLQHPHILTCHAGWKEGLELRLLSETAKYTVRELVLEKATSPPQALYTKWLYQLASALKYLHEDQKQPILHRNIKPNNIMVVDHYVLKLSDFGFSKQLRDKEDVTSSRVGTAITMSPEIVNNIPYNAKTDMWSLGITAVYIATLQEAVCARSFHTLFCKTSRGEVRGIADQYSQDTQNIVHSLLQVDPRHRPTASELMTGLRLNFRTCTKPAGKDSYPGRQTVPQKGSPSGLSSGAAATLAAAISNHSARPRRTSEPARGMERSGTAQAEPRRRDFQRPVGTDPSDIRGKSSSKERSDKPAGTKTLAKSCQTTPSLVPRDREVSEQEADRRIDRSSMSVTSTVPTEANLSLAIVCIVMDNRNRSNIQPSEQPIHSRRLHVSGPQGRLRRSTESAISPVQTSESSPPRTPDHGSRVYEGFNRTFPLADLTHQRMDWPNTDTRMTSECQDTKQAFTDTSNSGIQMINTFPGGYNVDRVLPRGRLPPLQRPPSTKSSGKKSKPVIRQHSEPLPQPEELEVSGSVQGLSVSAREEGAHVEGSLHSSPLSDVPKEHWPTNLRQYWTIAEDLLSILSADAMLYALKLAKLFSKEEVQMWLLEEHGQAASERIEDILTLVHLDEQLDADTVLACNQTLLQLGDAGESSS